MTGSVPHAPEYLPVHTAYDPFARGAHPVGVRTVEAEDGLVCEVWYPAARAHAGTDLDPARQDRYRLFRATPAFHQPALRGARPAPLVDLPLIVFSHGLGGHRRQSAFLTTHLASHGYVVIAPDHAGSTYHALLRNPRRQALGEMIAGSAQRRVRDVRALAERFPAAAPEVARLVSPEVVAVCGHSFGGWTAVAATSEPSPFRCGLAMAPIGTGGRNPAFEAGDAYATFDLGYASRPPTLLFAAERDSICRLRGIERLHGAIGPGHRLFVLHDAEHFHFCDYVRFVHGSYALLSWVGSALGISSLRMAPARALIGEAAAHDAVRAVAVAHFDHHLRGETAAAAFLRHRLDPALADRGARITRR